MKVFTIASSMSLMISTILASALLPACTHRNVPQTERIDIGASVLLEEYALACKQPSEELNNIAKSNGKDLRDLAEKISLRADCYDVSSFEKGQWKVLAKNDRQLLIKMQGRSGEYWVSSMHVRLGELPVIKLEKTRFQSSP